MKFAVAGATGRVGRPLVDILKTAGHNVVPMSRSTGVDIVTGEGLGKALTGVETIIDAASGSSPQQDEATKFFTTAARNLQQNGARAGVRQIVVVSIIGVDKFTAGYMAAKLAHEQAMQSGPIPTRILRAAQFHELVAQMMEWGKQGDVVYIPKMRTQLVAARAVAEKLADFALQPPAAPGSPFLEVAGPRPENLVDAAILIARRRGDPVRIAGMSDPSDPDRAAYDSGAQLPGRNAILAGPTFEEWLNATPLSAKTSRSAV